MLYCMIWKGKWCSSSDDVAADGSVRNWPTTTHTWKKGLRTLRNVISHIQNSDPSTHQNIK